MKQNLLLLLLMLAYTFSLGSAIECKICDKYDKSCVFGQDTAAHQCKNDDDLCYSWFSRSGTSIRAQRGCISITSSAYNLIKTILRRRNSACVKSIRALDCFTFCSTDLCN